MIITPAQQQSLKEASLPLIKWLNENCHPHVTVIVTPDSYELKEGVSFEKVRDFIQD